MSEQTRLSRQQGQTLLDLAFASIRHGIEHDAPLPVALHDYPEELRAPRGVFVTIEFRGELLGCIGSLQAQQPLALAVAQRAFDAAFRDPRTSGVNRSLLEHLDVHISILSPLERMQFSSEEDFLRQLRPGVDGILIEDGFSRGTFLPVVWEKIPNPKDFLNTLKQKAGLPPTYWSTTLKAYRYTTQSIPEE